MGQILQGATRYKVLKEKLQGASQQNIKKEIWRHTRILRMPHEHEKNHLQVKEKNVEQVFPSQPSG